MRFALAAVIAALCGFVALSYEILWFRAFSFVSWTSPAVFGLLLAYYLGGVAVGSRHSRKWLADGEDNANAVRIFRVALLILSAAVTSYAVVPLTARLAAHGGWLVAFALVALSTALLGAVLPLVAHYGIVADRRAGEFVAYIYLANIAGSAAGSLATGFILLDVWPLATASIFLAALSILSAALLLLVSGRATARRGLLACAAAGALLVVAHHAAFDQVYERLLWKTNFTGAQRFRNLVENRHGVIAVAEGGAVYGGGAYDGAFNVSLRDDRNHIARAFAVAALHPEPRDVLVIGLATGSWVRVIANLKGVERMTVIEINPGYLGLIANEENVASILRDPKVHIEIDDGRRWLLRHPDARFDMIVMNTTWHFRAQATNLLSTEFLAVARAHLKPGGVHYFNATGSDEVARTAAVAFPYALGIANFVAVSDAPIVFNRERWRGALLDTRFDGKAPIDPENPADVSLLQDLLGLPARVDQQDPPFYAVRTRDGILRATAGSGVVTDDNMACEWRHALTLPGPPVD